MTDEQHELLWKAILLLSKAVTFAEELNDAQDFAEDARQLIHEAMTNE